VSLLSFLLINRGYGIMQNPSPKIKRRKTLFLQKKSKIDGINPKGMEHPNNHLKSDNGKVC
jgi:hypothetical protein